MARRRQAEQDAAAQRIQAAKRKQAETDALRDAAADVVRKTLLARQGRADTSTQIRRLLAKLDPLRAALRARRARRERDEKRDASVLITSNFRRYRLKQELSLRRARRHAEQARREATVTISLPCRYHAVTMPLP